jgi:hypothetical protein
MEQEANDPIFEVQCRLSRVLSCADLLDMAISGLMLGRETNGMLLTLLDAQRRYAKEADSIMIEIAKG